MGEAACVVLSIRRGEGVGLLNDGCVREEEGGAISEDGKDSMLLAAAESSPRALGDVLVDHPPFRTAVV